MCHEGGVRLADAVVLPAAQVLIAHLDAHLAERTASLRAGSAPLGPASSKIPHQTQGIRAGNRRTARGTGAGMEGKAAHQPPCWS